MYPFQLHAKKWWGVLFLALSVGLMALIWTWALANSNVHNFEGKCQMCHSSVPTPGTPFEEIILKDNVDRLCANCHSINQRTSHPVNMRPRTSIPLQRYLDQEGRMTCITCHEVHKEENNSFSRRELKGLLRGHAQGRAFCFICHNNEMLGANWRHEMVITYAHAPDRLSQNEHGSLLDPYSVECLSCHDGVVSKMTTVEVRSGDFQHNIGLSHPVGVEYPTMGHDNEFTPRNILPEEVKLFDGKVGCLSCHNPYGGKKSLLVMDNHRSALCFTCHRK